MARPSRLQATPKNPGADYCPPDEVTGLRIWSEMEGAGSGSHTVWRMDGADDRGNYSEACWTFPTWQEANLALRGFVVENFPHLLDNPKDKPA